ncbi:MAG TPA: type II secretion system protein GspC [Kofleriaceae bacterium]|nr:type II secretion system protein GspC [Kofleriaceae bacterium]
MQAIVKKYFWVLGVIVVITCAFFVAKAANHVAEAKLLGDPAKAPNIPHVIEAQPQVVAAVHSKDGTAMATRNMFCSDCTPPVEAQPQTNDPSQIAITSLPLVLVATNVSDVPKYSFATIFQNNESQKQGGFYVGDAVPGAGPIKEIHYKYIDFENNGHTERLVLLGATPPPMVAAAPPPAVDTPPPSENKDEMQAAIDSGIRKISDNNYEIDKALVEKVLANPMAVAKGARVVPAMKDGKPAGFKLYAIRPDSVYAKLGLSNGDTIDSINGFDLTSAEKALEVYTKLREATALQMDVTRRGKPVELKYSIK